MQTVSMGQNPDENRTIKLKIWQSNQKLEAPTKMHRILQKFTLESFRHHYRREISLARISVQAPLSKLTLTFGETGVGICLDTVALDCDPVSVGQKVLATAIIFGIKLEGIRPISCLITSTGAVAAL